MPSARTDTDRLDWLEKNFVSYPSAPKARWFRADGFLFGHFMKYNSIRDAIDAAINNGSPSKHDTDNDRFNWLTRSGKSIYCNISGSWGVARTGYAPDFWFKTPREAIDAAMEDENE